MTHIFDKVELEKHLHIFARSSFVKMNFKPDKSLLRWNDIVAVGVHYYKCGMPRDISIAEDGVIEALEACNPACKHAYIKGRGPLTMINRWMEC